MRQITSRDQGNDLLNFPGVIADSSLHRQGNAQGLMNPAVVVVHDVKRDHGGMIFNLFGKRIGQPSEPAHVNSHVKNSSGDVGIVRRFAWSGVNRGRVLRSWLMPTEHILALLIAERDKLNRAIEALGGTGTKRRGRPRKNPVGEVGTVTQAPVPAKNHHMRSPAARKAQAQRMKAYWAKRKKSAGR